MSQKSLRRENANLFAPRSAEVNSFAGFVPLHPNSYSSITPRDISAPWRERNEAETGVTVLPPLLPHSLLALAEKSIGPAEQRVAMRYDGGLLTTS